MPDYLKEILTRKNLINILILAILVLAVPLTINLVRRQQILKSKAATDTVQLLDNSCTSVQNSKKVLTCPTLTLNFVAPSEVDVVSDQGFVKKAYAQESCTPGKVCGSDCGAGGVGSCAQCNGGWCNGGFCNSCSAAAPTLAPTGSTCPTRPLQDIGNEELIAKCTLAEIALLPNERLQTFSLNIITQLPNERLMQMSLEFLAKLPNERLQTFSLEFLGKFPNDRLKSFTIEFLQKFSNDRLITFPLDVLAQFPAERIKTFPCEIQIQLGYQCGTTNIVKVWYAENESDLTNPNLRHEIAYVKGGVKQDITLDPTPGQKFIFTQFVDDKNQTQNGNPFPFQIELKGPTPTVSGFACELDLVNSSDLLFKFLGVNFGATQGTGTVVLKDGGNLSFDSWTDTAITARLTSPPTSQITVGTRYFATVTNSSGQKSAEQQCLVGITQISLGAKLFCRNQRDFDQDNVELVLISDKDRNQKTSEKVTIDKEGNIADIKTKLKAGDKYIACIKAPLSLRRCSAPFSASSGTNILSMDLPIGDYNGDGSINNVDASLLKGQWGPVSSSKNCDVNRDGFCNAFEWSCMLHDFNSGNQATIP